MTHAENSPLVRPRRNADISKTAVALIQTHQLDGYPVEGVEDPESWLTSPQPLHAWVAEIDGDIVGHVAINRPSHDDAAVELWRKKRQESGLAIAVLARLFAAPHARKNGVGTLLMKAATEHAASHGMRLVLDVVAKDVAAIRLYERLGWTRIGNAVHSFGAGRQTPAVCFASPDNRPMP